MKNWTVSILFCNRIRMGLLTKRFEWESSIPFLGSKYLQPNTPLVFLSINISYVVSSSLFELQDYQILSYMIRLTNPSADEASLLSPSSRTKKTGSIPCHFHHRGLRRPALTTKIDIVSKCLVLLYGSQKCLLILFGLVIEALDPRIGLLQLGLWF